MADMQSGSGPFVGVFLAQRGWDSGLIGTAMTIGSIAGTLITTPVGGFIDTSHHKRAWVIVPGTAVVAASSIILLWQNFRAVAASSLVGSAFRRRFWCSAAWGLVAAAVWVFLGAAVKQC